MTVQIMQMICIVLHLCDCDLCECDCRCTKNGKLFRYSSFDISITILILNQQLTVRQKT